MKKTIILFISLCLCACSTMEFVNGPRMEDTIVREKWHHLGFNGLIEFSKPMNLTYSCGSQEWDSFVVEQSLFNLLAGSASASISLTPTIFRPYSPWTIVYECRDPID
ncbi:hypothetical protein [Agarilytica rhodophyticola]|uniref:hypothetical protein n=1 Tax=Agarilytica rhodophyticola TaxID=1737490 RepID=UPI000B3488D3|nr:hypothetical protein [Agarilytica rhodophyticola]